VDIDKVCAFIPARGGSQGVKGKNWRMLGGLPLVNWTIEFANSLNSIEKIFLSTDSSQIAEVSTNGALTPLDFLSLPENSLSQISEKMHLHKRCAAQAGTLSLISDVLYEFTLQNRIYEEYEYLLLLQPTSPFRSAIELGRLLELASQQSKWSSIVSVKDVGGMHPNRMYRIVSQWATPILDQKLGDDRPRQSLERLYIKDGAYYLLRTENLLNKTLLGNKILSFERQGLWTVNIDTEEDFAFAEFAAQKLGFKK
jgi:CMP-N,N'-diacetyllegionaminic acid synthase